jgi:CheY-like chemotaxis protein
MRALHTVLYVEDNPANLMLVEDLVAPARYPLAECADGNAASRSRALRCRM